MRLEHFLIGLAVFFVVIALGVAFYNESLDNYNIAKDSVLFENLTSDDYEEYNENIDSLREDNLQGGSEVKDEDTESSIYKSALDQISKLGSIVTTPGKLINRIGKRTGLIPDFISDFFINILLILAISFVIYMFVRFKPQD